MPLIRGEGESPVPQVAQVDTTPSAFETEIWTRFWAYANDPKAAAAAGIKVAQGEAPHVKAQERQVYQLRATERWPRYQAAAADARVVDNRPGRADA